MIFLAVIFSVAAIGVLCWLLFTLAIYALPAFAGVTAGMWAYDTGAGWPGGIAIGLIAAGLIFGVGQLLLAFARPLWLRVGIALAFVAPAAIAGYHATRGIVKHTMPSEGWQIAFSVVGAIAVGIAAFLRIAAMAARTGRTGDSAGLTPTRPLDAWPAGRHACHPRRRSWTNTDRQADIAM
ncbi:MAG: hypothetical protein ACOY4R_24230 [Pseudomonadota bacterium]